MNRTAKNAGENQADEKNGAAPKPNTRVANGVTIIDVTNPGTAVGIIGGVHLPQKKTQD